MGSFVGTRSLAVNDDITVFNASRSRLCTLTTVYCISALYDFLSMLLYEFDEVLFCLVLCFIANSVVKCVGAISPCVSKVVILIWKLITLVCTYMRTLVVSILHQLVVSLEFL